MFLLLHVPRDSHMILTLACVLSAILRMRHADVYGQGGAVMSECVM